MKAYLVHPLCALLGAVFHIYGRRSCWAVDSGIGHLERTLIARKVRHSVNGNWQLMHMLQLSAHFAILKRQPRSSVLICL